MADQLVPELLNKGSLITYKDGDSESCLGFLLDLSDVKVPAMHDNSVPQRARGVWEPNFGLVPLTSEEAATHNRLLSTALIEGMKTAQIGQCGTFYVKKTDKWPLKYSVHTFTGEVVAEVVTCDKFRLRFGRDNMSWEARIPRGDDECATFTRIA